MRLIFEFSPQCGSSAYQNTRPGMTDFELVAAKFPLSALRIFSVSIDATSLDLQIELHDQIEAD